MTSNPAFLDALDALVETQDGVVAAHVAQLDALRNVRDAAGADGPPATGQLAPPADFTATLDPETRRVTTRWTPQDDDVERHERLRPPTDTTLRATISGDQGTSTSSALAAGPSEWALRSRRGDQVSDFTRWIPIDLPAGQDDDQGEDDDTPPAQDGPVPVDVIPELELWTVMLPVMKPDGDTPRNDYAGVWGNVPDQFFVRDRAVVFRAPADGDHSKNSNYARSEARQMRGPDWDEGAWPSSGSHTMTFDLGIDTRGLTTRPRICGAQIHGGGDDVMQLIYERGVGLGVSHQDGNAWELLWPDYRDAQRFTGQIAAINNRITVYLDGSRVLDIPKTGSTWYFKIGCYLQTGGASKHHEPEGAFGEVVLYSLTTTGGGQ